VSLVKQHCVKNDVKVKIVESHSRHDTGLRGSDFIINLGYELTVILVETSIANNELKQDTGCSTNVF